MTEIVEPRTLTELNLNQELRELIDHAYMDGNFPVIVAYVDGDRPGSSDPTAGRSLEAKGA